MKKILLIAGLLASTVSEAGPSMMLSFVGTETSGKLRHMQYPFVIGAGHEGNGIGTWAGVAFKYWTRGDRARFEPSEYSMRVDYYEQESQVYGSPVIGISWKFLIGGVGYDMIQSRDDRNFFTWAGVKIISYPGEDE